MNITNSVVNVGQQDVGTQGNPAAPAGLPAGLGEEAPMPTPAGGDLPPAGGELPPFQPIGEQGGAMNLPPLGDLGATPPAPAPEPAPPMLATPPPPPAPDTSMMPEALGPPDLEPAPIGPSFNPALGRYE
jgi:hypothetical protein